MYRIVDKLKFLLQQFKVKFYLELKQNLIMRLEFKQRKISLLKCKHGFECKFVSAFYARQSDFMTRRVIFLNPRQVALESVVETIMHRFMCIRLFILECRAKRFMLARSNVYRP